MNMIDDGMQAFTRNNIMNLKFGDIMLAKHLFTPIIFLSFTDSRYLSCIAIDELPRTIELNIASLISIAGYNVIIKYKK